VAEQPHSDARRIALERAMLIAAGGDGRPVPRRPLVRSSPVSQTSIGFDHERLLSVASPRLAGTRI
jgi:hypothetical protein